MMLTASCKKDYLETIPTGAIPTSLVFTTTARAATALNGIHRSLYIQYLAQDQGGEGSAMINLDALGDDLVMTTTGNNWFISTYQWLAHRTVNSAMDAYMYAFYYQVIANANLALDKIPGITPMDESLKKKKLAEASFLRAWAYFYAVQ